MRYTQRIWELDAARGLAIVMMISFHFLYDLRAYGGNGGGLAGIPQIFWDSYSTLIATTFLLVVGISGWIKHAADCREESRSSGRGYVRNGLKILAAAAVVTVASLISMPGYPIYFGILHCIGFTVLAMPLWLKLGRWNGLAGVLMILVGNLFLQHPVHTKLFFWLALKPYPMPMADYFPILPWSGITLIGLDLARRLHLENRDQWLTADWGGFGLSRGLCWLGRHSLWIYLIHQPIMVGLLAITGVIQFG